MVQVEHTLVVRCDTLQEYNWALDQLQKAVATDTDHPIQSVTPFLGQKRINVGFVPQSQYVN